MDRPRDVIDELPVDGDMCSGGVSLPRRTDRARGPRRCKDNDRGRRASFDVPVDATPAIATTGDPLGELFGPGPTGIHRSNPEDIRPTACGTCGTPDRPYNIEGFIQTLYSGRGRPPPVQLANPPLQLLYRRMAIIRRTRPNWCDTDRMVALCVLLLNDFCGANILEVVHFSHLAVGGVLLNYWDGAPYVAIHSGVLVNLGRVIPAVILSQCSFYSGAVEDLLWYMGGRIVHSR